MTFVITHSIRYNIGYFQACGISFRIRLITPYVENLHRVYGGRYRMNIRAVLHPLHTPLFQPFPLADHPACSSPVNIPVHLFPLSILFTIHFPIDPRFTQISLFLLIRVPSTG